MLVLRAYLSGKGEQEAGLGPLMYRFHQCDSGNPSDLSVMDMEGAHKILLLRFCEAGTPPRQWYTKYSGPETLISLVFILFSPSLMFCGFMGQNVLCGLLGRSLFPFFIYFTSHTRPLLHTRLYASSSFANACPFTFKPHAVAQRTLTSNLHSFKAQHYNLHTTTTMPL